MTSSEEIDHLKRQVAELEADKRRLDWQSGTPDVPAGKMRRFWCSVKHFPNERLVMKLLCYGNAYAMPLSDDCDGPPANAVPIEGDDENFAWTGWWEESCDQCDTYWAFNGTVVQWMELPARAAMQSSDGKAT